MKDVKMLLVDVENRKVETVTTNELGDYYKYIGCDLVDIVTRNINGKPFRIICDDCGLYKEDPIPSAMNKDRIVMFVGNLLIAGDVDKDGWLTSITEDDVNFIKNCISERIDFTRGCVIPLLTKCEY